MSAVSIGFVLLMIGARGVCLRGRIEGSSYHVEALFESAPAARSRPPQALPASSSRAL